MDMLKNPILIGLTMGAIIYAYLTYTVNEKNEENKKKKKHKRKEKETVNLLIPLVVAIISWFIAYAYFEYNSDASQQQQSNNSHVISDIREKIPLPIPVSSKYGFIEDVQHSSTNTTEQPFSLINTGLNVPKNLPDVLLDIA